MTVSETISHLAMAALCVLVLLAVGQPLYTDDLWWHLALGDAYRAQGPWIVQDPALYLAQGPPLPASWLADAFLASIADTLGVGGLRVLHVLLAVAVLFLAWSLLKRASGSRWIASLGTGFFAILAAYRLFQLRPHLGTLLAVLILYRLLMEEGQARSPWKWIAVGALLVVWANVHAGFVLGLVLPAIALASLLVALPMRSPQTRQEDFARARFLFFGLVVGVLASFLNPSAADSHLAYLTAGVASPELSRVGDEWARLTLFDWPRVNMPPSPLSWLIAWCLALGTFWIALQSPGRWKRNAPSAGASVDPVLLGLALASLVALCFAVRFLWMGVFPLLLLAQGLRSGGWAQPGLRTPSRSWALALLAVLLIPAFLRLGPWPMISRGIPANWKAYTYPYAADKYFAHSIWFMKDAELQGNLFNNYSVGSFASYWLPPELKLFVNGSLNVPREAMDAGYALRHRQGMGPDAGFEDLLGRYEVDVFFGVRLPQRPFHNRPTDYTTGHLENSPGWIPVFRNLHSAVYVRGDERNQANLERVARYYAAQNVPFDTDTGFDAIDVIREQPGWAVRHGMIPTYFSELVQGSRSGDPEVGRRSQNRLASVYASLGVYDKAIALDRRLLLSYPGLPDPSRRLVWSLIRSDRAEEALAVVDAFEKARGEDSVSPSWVEAAEAYAAETDPETRAALRANLPLLSHGEARILELGTVSAEARPLTGRVKRN